MNTNKIVLDKWLNAGLSASSVISVGVKACFGWVDFDDVFKFGFTSVEAFFPEMAVWFALFKKLWFWILTFLKHCLNVSGRLKMWCQSWLGYGPSWCDPSGNSSSHLFNKKL